VWAAFPQALILAVSLRVPKENAGRRRIGCRVPEQRGRDRCCRFVMPCAAPAWLRAGSNGDLYRASMADVLRVVGILSCEPVSDRMVSKGVVPSCQGPTCDASDAGLDASAIQHDARALASEVTLAGGNSKSSFSEIRTLVAGAVDRETEWRARNRCPL
jgi:hypothetical protein